MDQWFHCRPALRESRWDAGNIQPPHQPAVPARRDGGPVPAAATAAGLSSAAAAGPATTAANGRPTGHSGKELAGGREETCFEVKAAQPSGQQCFSKRGYFPSV